MRTGLIILLLLALCVLLYVFFFGSRAPESFLLITIDTLRADHVGAYGYSRKITPALDRLAEEGVVFKNVYCVMPTTVPSHGSLFFSTWPRIHGSTSNFVHFSNTDLAFLPDVLQKAGYAVGAIVSVPHLGKNFQKYASFHEIDFPERERNAESTLRIARRWLGNNKNRKFFLWIHLWDPHSPYDLHPEFMKQIHPDADVNFEKHYAFLKDSSYTSEEVRTMIDLYDNEIAYTDFHLGRFLEDFRAMPAAKRTTIIVTSDHGETLGELLATEGYAFDHGEYLYDHQLHVPLIMVGPKLKHNVVNTTVTLLDIMPTIFQRAGLPRPPTAQGNSFSSLIDSTGRSRPDSIAFLERREFTSPPMPFLAERQFGVRDRNYKLLYNESSRQSFMYKNGAEGVDVSDEQKRLKELMQQRLLSWLSLTSKLSKGRGTTVSEEEAEKLRALGYVQ